MVCRCLLSCLLLLVAVGPLLSHHVSDSSEMSSYQAPASVEEDQVASPQEVSLSDQAYTSQNAAGFGYPSLVPERNGLRSSVHSANQEVKKALAEKPILNPLTRLLISSIDDRKRTTTECFWKYCV